MSRCRFPLEIQLRSNIARSTPIPLPLRPHIDREVRAENQGHCSVVIQHDPQESLGFEPFAERPPVFNPTSEPPAQIAFRSIQSTEEAENRQRFNSCLAYFDRALSGGVSVIKSLEMRDMDWKTRVGLEPAG